MVTVLFGAFMLLIIFSVRYISTVLLHKVNLVFIFVGMQAKKWKIVSEIQWINGKIKYQTNEQELDGTLFNYLSPAYSNYFCLVSISPLSF